MDLGEYPFENFTLINPLVTKEDSQLVALHEYMHYMLSIQSVVGEMLYCLKKISKLAAFNNRGDYEKDYRFYSELMKHSKKTQEGMAVLFECFAILQLEGLNGYKKYVETLKLDNKLYYDYFKPLKFLADIIAEEKDDEAKFLTVRYIFLLAVHALNAKIYETNPDIWLCKKSMKKFESKAVASEYLPDSRFKKAIKYLKNKNINSCVDIQESIEEWLRNNGYKDRPLESATEEMNKIKTFLISFFVGSSNIEFYREQLNGISSKEISAEELFLNQLPSIPVSYTDDLCKADLKVFLDIAKKRFTVLFLLGNLKLGVEMMFSKWGINEASIRRKNQQEYLQKADLENRYHEIEFVVGYDWSSKKVFSSMLEPKEVDSVITEIEHKGKNGACVLTSYKNYDYEKNCIKNHENITGDIYIYCDRTYGNARPYLDSWKEKIVYYRRLEYRDMIVLLIWIAANRIFILPMTGAVEQQAFYEILTKRSNMKPAEDDEDSRYDKYILRDESCFERIDTIINSLFFIKV